MNKLLKNVLIAITLSTILFSCENPSKSSTDDYDFEETKYPKPEVTIPNGYTPSTNVKSVTSAFEGDKILKITFPEIFNSMKIAEKELSIAEKSSDREASIIWDEKVEKAYKNFIRNNKTYTNQLAYKGEYPTIKRKCPNIHSSQNGTLTLEGFAKAYISQTSSKKTIKAIEENKAEVKSSDYKKFIEDCIKEGNRLKPSEYIKSITSNVIRKLTAVQGSNSTPESVIQEETYQVAAFFDDESFNGIIEMEIKNIVIIKEGSKPKKTKFAKIEFLNPDGTPSYTYSNVENDVFLFSAPALPSE